MAALGVTVDFTANIANFTNQINRISGNLDQFQRHAETMSSRVSKAFGALGVGLSVAGLVSFVKNSIDVLDNLNDLSIQTGITVEKLSGLSLIAKQSGTDLETMALAINKSSVNIAKNGEAFKKLGVDTKDPFIALTQLADIFNSIEDPMQRAAFAQKAFGKSWADLAPTLALGGDKIRRLADEGEKASMATKSLAEEADKFNDTLIVMGARLGSIGTILGGVIATKFNQFIDTMSVAIESGTTFYNVMKGIADFGVRNYFTGFKDIQTTGLDELNDKIKRAENNLKSIKELAGPRNFIAKFGADGNREQILAQERLNNLIVERNKLQAQEQKPKKTPTSKDVQKFIVGSGAGEASSNRAAASHTRAKTAVNQLQKSYESMLESMTREIALRDKNSEAAKLEYEIINGNLKGLGPLQQQKLISLAKEHDALERQDKQWAALVESANEYYDLRKSNDDLIRSGEIQSGFDDAIASVDDALKNFSITVEQAKAEYTKLGMAFNDEFVTPAQEATDRLSEYGIQAARNMQSSFADFLFDPFSQSMGSLLDNFVTMLRRMAAEAAAAMIFDALKKDGAQWIDSLISGIASIFGAFGGASSVAASDAAFLASAKGNIFERGNVVAFNKGQAFNDNIVPFAGGSVVNKPTAFPMAGGKTGLMGEAGPEAIMPLSRDSSGRLGIVSQNQAPATNITVIVQGNNNAPDVRRAAGQGAREALGLMGGASRYG